MNENTKTGNLAYFGEKKLGVGGYYRYYICTDCANMYPVIDGRISCNGHKIDSCPWCRPDSEPWKNGRGA